MLPKTMSALVKYGVRPGEVELREVPIPQIKSTEVLLKTAACGICGSDLEMYHHNATYVIDVPVTLGHEFSGTIVQVGDEVDNWHIGDRVVSETAAYICGKCPLCLTSQYNLCPNRRGYGSRVNGAFADYVRVPARILHRVPNGLDLESAATTEPISVAYNALVVKSNINTGDTVVIFGAGPIGLFATQIAKLSGAGKIILTGLGSDVGRLKVGRRVGAEEIVNIEVEDLSSLVMEWTDGLGADLIVDAAGANSILEEAMKIVRPNGQITKIGWDPRPVGFSLDPLLIKAVTFQGVFSHTWPTWEKVLTLMGGGKINVDALISHRLSITEWKKAFELVESREAIKALIIPSSS
jgi:alcohol dehydrogenase/L-iditol 2-dehydrogenase